MDGWMDGWMIGMRGWIFFMHIIAGKRKQKRRVKKQTQRRKTTVYDNAYFSFFDRAFIMLHGIKALAFFSSSCFCTEM